MSAVGARRQQSSAGTLAPQLPAGGCHNGIMQPSSTKRGEFNASHRNCSPTRPGCRRAAPPKVWRTCHACTRRHFPKGNERTSPGLMSPRRTASSRASGMEAALVLPYCDRLLTTRSAEGHTKPVQPGQLVWIARQVADCPLVWYKKLRGRKARMLLRRVQLEGQAGAMRASGMVAPAQPTRPAEAAEPHLAAPPAGQPLRS